MRYGAGLSSPLITIFVEFPFVSAVAMAVSAIAPLLSSHRLIDMPRDWRVPSWNYGSKPTLSSTWIAVVHPTLTFCIPSSRWTDIHLGSGKKFSVHRVDLVIGSFESLVLRMNSGFGLSYSFAIVSQPGSGMFAHEILRLWMRGAQTLETMNWELSSCCWSISYEHLKASRIPIGGLKDVAICF